MERVRWWLQQGLELIQIRETSLSGRELFALTRSVLALPNPHGSKILVNDRVDVAIACQGHGVHMRDRSVKASSLRGILPAGFLISVSCHDLTGVLGANGADFLVIAPVFRPLSKEDDRTPLGLAGLGELAGATSIPVLALGGISNENSAGCIAAGAIGVAGITYFQNDAIALE